MIFLVSLPESFRVSFPQNAYSRWKLQLSNAAVDSCRHFRNDFFHFSMYLYYESQSSKLRSRVHTCAAFTESWLLATIFLVYLGYFWDEIIVYLYLFNLFLFAKIHRMNTSAALNTWPWPVWLSYLMEKAASYSMVDRRYFTGTRKATWNWFGDIILLPLDKAA